MRAQVVLVEDGRVLMVRLQRPGRSFWVLPGGAIESDETPQDAAVREVREETGLEVAIDRVLFVEEPRTVGGVEIRSPRHTFLARRVGGELCPQYDEVAEVAWLPPASDAFDATTEDTMRRVRLALGQAEGDGKRR
jgi:8-oxo-dGTP pyrophosphatase MutT (NUDIX family)